MRQLPQRDRELFTHSNVRIPSIPLPFVSREIPSIQFIARWYVRYAPDDAADVMNA